MATNYHVYANNLAGGPIDYSTPIATTASLTYTTATILSGSDASYAVRAFDTVSGLEELNTEAVVRIVTDATGANITNRPRSPRSLNVRATAGGTAKVEWSINPGPRETAPATYRLWMVASPGPIDYTQSPTKTVAASNPLMATSLTGLTDGVTYLVAVRSVNATGDDGNTITASVVGSTTGPGSVDNLTASLI